MLLAIDIGNSNINIGVWDDQTLCQEWRLYTDHNKTADEYGLFLVGLLRERELDKSIDGVILASVVPILSQTFVQICRTTLKQDPLVITADLDLGIKILVNNPHELGADRLVDAVAAFGQFSRPCIVIDMGTATTFDAISAQGELLGGVICPGLRLIADALSSHTAKLSQVPLTAPPQATGQNTVHATQSGLIFGYAALIEGMVQRLIAEHPDPDSNILVLGTGGLIHLISPYIKPVIQIEPHLTLTGLRMIYQRVNH